MPPESTSAPASEVYNKLQNEIHIRLTNIANKLRRHSNEQDERPEDWAFVTELERVNALVRELEASL